MKEMSATEGIYNIAVTNAIEPITTDPTLLFQRIALYPAKAVVNGILTPNTGDIYLGRSLIYLPDKRVPADVDYPVIYELPLGAKMRLADIRIKGTLGDGVLFSFT